MRHSLHAFHFSLKSVFANSENSVSSLPIFQISATSPIANWRSDGLTISGQMIRFTIMKTKTATVADLRNHFRRVSAWIENGEQVEILKRGKSFARLVPSAEQKPKKFVVPDFMARLKETWGDRVFTAAEVEEMRRFEDGED